MHRGSKNEKKKISEVFSKKLEILQLFQKQKKNQT